jgi:hypothetical protein
VRKKSRSKIRVDRKRAGRDDEIAQVQQRSEAQRDPAGVDEYERTDDLRMRRREMDGDLSAHRIADHVHRLIERPLDPSGEDGGDARVLDRKSAAPDEVERDGQVPLGDRGDVPTPPIRGAAESVNQNDGRAGARAPRPEPIGRDLHALRVA